MWLMSLRACCSHSTSIRGATAAAQNNRRALAPMRECYRIRMRIALERLPHRVPDRLSCCHITDHRPLATGQEGRKEVLGQKKCLEDRKPRCQP